MARRRTLRPDDAQSFAAQPPDAMPGFDFSGRMKRLCRAFCTTLPELSHIDMDRVAVGFCQARRAVTHGMQASLTPLRFAGGELFTRRGTRTYTIQRVFDTAGVEQLYLLNFYLPRFLDRPYTDKLTTVAHELWHISPRFDGDMRRHEGRCFAHSPSKQAFDDLAAGLARQWLATQPDEALHGFLRQDFRTLTRQFGLVHGTRYARPKLLPAPPRGGV
ncbi:MAG: hypothetical protein K1X74_02790 [Pirellulales bacterium]|nr:hypothetical protein [Pirellulales bacterium]